MSHRRVAPLARFVPGAAWLAVAVGGAGLPRLAAADESSPVAVQVQREGNACRDRAFEPAVRVRARRAVAFVSSASSPSADVVHLDVGVARDGGADDVAARSGPAPLHGTLRFSSRRLTDRADVHGETCAEVLDALALLAASWVEAAEPAPNPAPVPAPEARAPSTTPWPADHTPEASRRPPTFGVGLAVFGATQLGPNPAAGGALFVERRGLAGSVLRGFDVRAAVRVASAASDLSGSPRLTWVTAALDGCARALAPGRLHLGACLRGEGGGVDVPRADGPSLQVPFAALGLGARAGVDVGPGRFELEVFGIAPVRGLRAVGATVERPWFPSFGPALALGWSMGL